MTTRPRMLRANVTFTVLILTCVLACRSDEGARSDDGDAGNPPARVETTIELPETLPGDIAAEWERRWGRPATDEELAGAIAARVREEVMAREAVAMELDRDDPVIRRHLAMKLERLIGDMAGAKPTEEELATYLAEHADRYREEARLDLEQVFVEIERRGLDAAGAEAERLLAALEAGDADPAELGDATMLPQALTNARVSQVERHFGRDFAARVAELEPGAWHGPIRSSFGLHLVRVDEVTPAAMPPLDTVRGEVERDLLADRRREAIETNYERMRPRYDVRVGGEPLDP